MAEEERIRQWRAQLAEEADSDDEGGGFGLAPPPGGMGGAPKPSWSHDGDMGLNLKEPAPSRLHGVASRAPPPRSGQGPAMGALRGAMPSGEAERELVLQHKLQVLQLKLEERELELDEARSAAEPAAAGRAAGPGDLRDEKFKDLAKRSKAATMALGKERAKAAQLAAELAGAKRELEKASAAPVAGDHDAENKELREARNQLAASNAKLHEQRLQMQASHAELQKYQRALAKEVGDDVAVGKLLEEGSNAKGRAQQITLLKDKLRELNRRIEAGTAAPPLGAAGPGSPGGDERQREKLQAMEAERRAEAERLMLREQQLAAEVAELRKRGDAQAARIKNLEGDSKGKREKLVLMLNKSGTDDQLISALRNELDKHIARANGGGGGGGGGAVAENGGRTKELAAKLAAQQVQIDRQEQIILSLRDELERRNDELERRNAEEKSPLPLRPASRPGSSGGWQPQDLIAAQMENAKLRELVSLLRQKLAQGSP